jgi:6-phosphogluconolactonase
MKFSKFGRISLALGVSLGMGFGVTSCSTNHAVGYFYVTGSQYSQIGGFRIQNNLGNLTATENSPYSSGGYDPIKMVVANAGKFLYVLNAGCGQSTQSPCPSGTAADETGANISLFTIGGQGGLSFQASYTSQGNAPISLAADSSGTHLFVLDSTVPNPSTCKAYVGTAESVCGDITAFNIDPNTGRLSLITNQTVSVNGVALTYFPVGTGPINLALTPSNSYIYVIEKGQANSTLDPPQAVFVYGNTSGQLTLTQNTPIPTPAEDLSFIYASAKYVYLIDAGQNVNPSGQILPYTVGTNGALQSLVTGAVNNSGTTADPGPMVVDHQGKFFYLANQGPNLTQTSPASSVSAFFINQTNGLLEPLTGASSGTAVTFGSASGPQCILEDPSNQYLYTANFNDSTVTGAIINSSTGTLTTLRKNTSFPTVGQPTWCVASGTLF